MKKKIVRFDDLKELITDLCFDLPPKIIICQLLCLVNFITYEEQHNKGHNYRTISHVCHNKIVCPLGNFIACDWLS